MTVLLFSLRFAARLMASTLAPLTNERAELADAIADVVYEDERYETEEVKLHAVAVRVAVAHREGSLLTSAIGDNGHSYCAFQIHDSSGGTRALTEDAHRCAAAGHTMLRASFRVCPAHPVAWYAEGPGGCNSARAQRISADRMTLAKKVFRDFLTLRQ